MRIAFPYILQVPNSLSVEVICNIYLYSIVYNTNNKETTVTEIDCFKGLCIYHVYISLSHGPNYNNK